MKIAIVCFNLSLQSGGPRLIFSTAQSLKKMGHAVRIYAPEFSGKYFKELWGGLDIRVVPASVRLLPAQRSADFFGWVAGKIRREFAHLRTAREIARAMDPDLDLLNVHDFAYPVGYFYKKRNPHVKVLWTENDPPFMYLPKKWKLFDVLSRLYNHMKDVASRKYFKAIDKVSVLDFYNKTWCEARGLHPVVIRLGVDFKKFYLPVKNFSSRAKGKEVRLFGLGSLNEYRHYEDVILAVDALRKLRYDARALIIASDMWNEKECREKLLKIIKDNNLGGAVDLRFKGVPDEDLRAAYKESDVFVYAVYLPPPRNGFGFSIGVFEAMAAGLPVVLCRTTTSTEVLEDMKTALFVDPMSPEQIAQKVRFLVDNPKVYFAIASAGQKFVKENLTWERYAKETLGISGGK